METKIYLVTRGKYSDYRVSAVFNEKELAEKYINSFKVDGFVDFRIEEYNLNPFSKELKKGYNPYFLRMKKNGECIEIYIKDSDYCFEDGEIKIKFDIEKNIYFNVFAKNENHAIKIANEKRLQLIVLNRWK